MKNNKVSFKNSFNAINACLGISKDQAANFICTTRQTLFSDISNEPEDMNSASLFRIYFFLSEYPFESHQDYLLVKDIRRRLLKEVSNELSKRTKVKTRLLFPANNKPRVRKR